MATSPAAEPAASAAAADFSSSPFMAREFRRMNSAM